MARLWRLLGHYNAETQSYSSCVGTLQTSPYTPDFNGTLVGIRTQVSAEAATSLVEHVQVKLTCTTFNPNSIEVYGQGNGLQTVPCQMQGERDFAVEQPVKAGVPITVEARNDVATAVTNSTFIWGAFVTG
jgi:hypothetical protein